jgi:hypothetical protein
MASADKQTRLTEITSKIALGTLSAEEGQKQLSELMGKGEKTVNYKISPKGCISFYGLRRMPISLYKQELDSILEAVVGQVEYSDEFAAFVEQHGDALNKKENKKGGK